MQNQFILAQIGEYLMLQPQSDNFTVQYIFRKSGLYSKITLILSTWFGTGLLPVAPGTFGTLSAIPIILVSDGLGIPYKVLILIIITAAAIWTSGSAQVLLGKNDPPEVVIDEVAGFLFMLFLPLSWTALALGFILFRVFDILKPYPIKKVEKLKGGFGIVFDDLLAGVYAYLCFNIIFYIFPSLF